MIERSGARTEVRRGTVDRSTNGTGSDSPWMFPGRFPGRLSPTAHAPPPQQTRDPHVLARTLGMDVKGAVTGYAAEVGRRSQVRLSCSDSRRAAQLRRSTTTAS